MLFSLIACLFSLLLYSDIAETAPEPANIRKRVVGYYDSTYYDTRCPGHRALEPDNIPGNAFTHINFKYSTIYPETYQIVPRSQSVPPILFTRTTDLKRTFPGLKVYISVGGNENEFDTASTQIFEEVASTSFNRARFIQQTLRFLQRYGFDGIDINWEELTPEHSQNYAKLVKELHMAFKAQVRTYGLSITVPGGAHYSNYPLKEIYPDVDFINLMSFDFHSSSLDTASPTGGAKLAPSTIINPPNPAKAPNTNATEPANVSLPELQPHASLGLFQGLLPSLEAMEVDLKKFNLMLTLDSRSLQASSADCATPGSGCTFKGPGPKRPCSARAGVLKYKDVIEYLADEDTKIIFDDKAFMNYAMTETAVWISFDDNRTWREKMNLAERNGFGGIAIENIESDSTSFEALDSLLFNRSPIYQDAMFVPRGTVYEPFRGSKHKRTLKKRAETGPQINTDPGTIYTMFRKRDVSQSGIIGGSGGQTCTKKPECDENEIELSKGCTDKICCKVWATPDPKKCTWRGSGLQCNGQCHGTEVTIAEDSCGDGGLKCTESVKVFCCQMAQPELKTQCSWSVCNGYCHDGYSGVATSNAHGLCAEGDYKTLCCPPESQWQGCHWVGKGDCAENRCGPEDVQLARDSHGDMKDGGACNWFREKALCCKPLHDMNPFAPVALRDIFPDNVITGDKKFDWRLTLDHSAHEDEEGLIPQGNKHTEDPSKTTFGFFSMMGDPDQVGNIDKREGSPYEVFDCPEPDVEYDKDPTKVRKLRAVCLGHASSCEEVFFGGIESKLIRLPEDCTANTYIRAHNFTVSPNQALPEHVRKRAMYYIEPVVRDLYFDYNFKLAKRAESIAYRIDYSNQPGYWETAVGTRSGSQRRDMTTPWKRNIFNDIGNWGMDLIHRIDDATTWTHVFKDESRFNFEELLGRVDKECEGNGMTTRMHMDVEIAGHVSGKIAFGISLLGGLLDGDGLQSIGFVKLLNTEAEINLDISGSAHWDGATEDYELAYIPLYPPYAQLGLFDIGPYAAVSGQMSGKLDMHAKLHGDFKASLGELRMNLPSYAPHSSKDAKASGIAELLVLDGDAQSGLEVTGSLSVSVAARLGFGIRIDAGLNNGGANEAGVEAVFNATAIGTLGLSLEEEGLCDGGLTFSAELAVEGHARIHGPDMKNWDEDTTMWNYTFIEYESVAVGEPLCFPLSPAPSLEVRTSIDHERRSTLIDGIRENMLIYRRGPNGKASTVISECLKCKDVDRDKAASHRCLARDEKTNEWKYAPDSSCVILNKKKHDMTSYLCNDIPYLTSDPEEKYWGDGVSDDEDDEEEDEDAEEDEEPEEGGEDREDGKDDSDDSAGMDIDQNQDSEDPGGSDLMDTDTEEPALSDDTRTPMDLDNEDPRDMMVEDQAAEMVVDSIQKRMSKSSKKKNSYTVCQKIKPHEDGLDFTAVKPEYPGPPFFRNLADNTLTGWIFKGSIDGADCGIVGVEERSVPMKAKTKVNPKNGKSVTTYTEKVGRYNVEHLWEGFLLRDFFEQLRPNKASEWCDDNKRFMGEPYTVKRTAPGGKAETLELKAIFQRLYDQYPSKADSERIKEFELLNGHLNRLKFRIFAPSTAILSSDHKIVSTQSSLRLCKDVISVMTYISDPLIWKKLIKTPIRIHETLKLLQDPNNIEGFHNVRNTPDNTALKYDLTDYAEKWQKYLGEVYWRVPAKARSFCVTHLNTVDEFARRHTPNEENVQRLRKAKIKEVAKILREKLDLIKLPVVDKDDSADYPMIEYTPTQKMKDSFPNWDYGLI